MPTSAFIIRLATLALLGPTLTACSAAASKDVTRHAGAHAAQDPPEAAAASPALEPALDVTDLAAAPAAEAPADEPAPPPIPPSTVVLLIGDSFALSGLSQSLSPRFKALGARYVVKSEQSSYTVTWSSRTATLVNDMQPDLVLISLGANEVANTRPESHAPAVRRIVESIGGRPCVWIAPPLWLKDTGIIDVIRKNAAPCRFFDTDAVVKEAIPRRGDKIHPNEEGGAVWADAVWSFLHAQRLPAAAADAPPARRSPWALRPGPAEEYAPREAATPADTTSAP